MRYLTPILSAQLGAGFGPSSLARFGLMIVDSRLLIFDVSLKPSLRATQAHLSNQKSTIRNRQSVEFQQRSGIEILSGQYWASRPAHRPQRRAR